MNVPFKGQTKIAHRFNDGNKDADVHRFNGGNKDVDDNRFNDGDKDADGNRFNDGNKGWILSHLIINAARLTFIHRRFAPEWLKLKNDFPELSFREWKHWWAVTEADRLRLRVEIDVLCAELYGLEPEDFDWIVRDDRTDPKGFWRVDKNLPYEQRLTGLAAQAFHALKAGKWSAETVGQLSNDEFFALLGIPELTNLEAAKAKGYEGPLIYNRAGCHIWKPETFPEGHRYGWTWEHCRADAVALLGSEEALKEYLKEKKEPSKNTETQEEDVLFDYKKPDPQGKLF